MPRTIPPRCPTVAPCQRPIAPVSCSQRSRSALGRSSIEARCSGASGSPFIPLRPRMSWIVTSAHSPIVRTKRPLEPSRPPLAQPADQPLVARSKEYMRSMTFSQPPSIGLMSNAVWNGVTAARRAASSSGSPRIRPAIRRENTLNAIPLVIPPVALSSEEVWNSWIGTGSAPAWRPIHSRTPPIVDRSSIFSRWRASSPEIEPSVASRLSSLTLIWRAMCCGRQPPSLVRTYLVCTMRRNSSMSQSFSWP